MPLPTERITLLKIENETIRAGLDRILNGFAEINAGLRYAPEVLDSRVRDKFKPRSLSDEIYGLILDLRNRLASRSELKKTKQRLTCVEFAIAAFAVRVGRNIREKQDTADLERMLETFRKRAKRQTIACLGAAEHRSTSERWRLGLNWIRYYVLPVRSPRFGFGKLRMCHEQYESMFKLAKRAMTERCTEPPPDELISKFVKLAIAEIRRPRHPGIKVKELISDPDKGKQFLFEFIRKRLDKRDIDLHLKVEYMPKCLQGSMRSEKLESAKVIEGWVPKVATRKPALTPASSTSTHLIPPSHPDIRVTPSIKAPMASQFVADWLAKDVERDFWEDVIGEAKYQLDRALVRKQRAFISTDVQGIQQECRPKTETCDSFEYINVNAEWLLTWTLALERESSRINSCYAEGLKQAIANYKPLDKRLSGINGVRYIGERMNGPFRP